MKNIQDEFEGTTTATYVASTQRYPSCYESHPPLKVGKGYVYGGSAGWPIVKDADIYIGLDSSMNFRNENRYPWHSEQSGPIEVLFRIADGRAPHNPNEFKAMIDWLAVQLIAGKKIHIGCIGGHGRTGMVLAALVNKVDGTEDAITYVRDHYCHKVVESVEQVEFLHKHYGIKKVASSRSKVVHVPVGRVSSLLKSSSEISDLEESWDERRKAAGAHKQAGVPHPLASRAALPSGPFVALPTASFSSVWGRKAVVLQGKFDKQAKPVKMNEPQEGAK